MFFSHTTCSTSYESKELIAREEAKESAIEAAQYAQANVDASTPSLLAQLGNITKRANSKKLSVVPEQDEQVRLLFLYRFSIVCYSIRR